MDQTCRSDKSLVDNGFILVMLFQLNATIGALRERLSVRQKKAAELKAKYNLGQ